MSAMTRWMLGILAAMAATAVHPIDGGDLLEPAQIGISPQLFELSAAEAGGSHSYRLHNLGRHDTRVRVRVANFGTNENNQVVLLPPDETSLDQWLVVNPLFVDLPAGQVRAVRFSVRPARPLPPGEHRAVIVFDEEPIEREAEGDGATVALKARFRITSAIYVSAGTVERSARLEAIALTPGQLQLTVQALGNGHARPLGRYRIEPVATAVGDAIEGDLARTPVFPGDTRTLITDLPVHRPLVPGRYRVHLTGTLGNEALNVVQELVVSGDGR